MQIDLQVPRMNVEQMAQAMERATLAVQEIRLALQPVGAALKSLASQFPQPPVRGRPIPLAADGLSYHRRYLARRRRSRR